MTNKKGGALPRSWGREWLSVATAPVARTHPSAMAMSSTTLTGSIRPAVPQFDARKRGRPD